MTGLLKSYGVFLLGIFCFISLMLMNQRLVLEDEIFESTRLTQYSVIENNILLGELFTNKKVVIAAENLPAEWVAQFRLNINLKGEYIIEIVGIHEDPPAIAVRVQGKAKKKWSQEEIQLDYTSLILIEEGR